MVDKEAQIEDLFSTLTAKGEEAGELSRKLIQLKNHILDQSLFEETFRVVRVPSAETASPLVGQSPLTQGLKGSQRKLTTATGMVLSFIRDMQMADEYFVKIETAPDNQGQPIERKLVPALHIKQVTAQNFTFTIVLHDECNTNDYDIVEEKVVSRRQQLTSALNPMKLLKKNPNQTKLPAFPMTFESDYVQKILECFRKLQTLALERQVLLQEVEQTQTII